MRIILVLAISLIACTKKNPDLCCVDEADCASVGLDEVQGCGGGLLCRGNQCIAEVCTSSVECDADAPYCVAEPDGRCQMQCSDSSQCPGFGESAEQVFCEDGACAECRADVNDCSGARPICETGRCVACTANAQCASGVCIEDGTCADEADVAYVSPTGAATGNCLALSPCNTITFALSLAPTRPFIVIDSGTYSQNATIRLFGTRRLIGRGATRPIIQRGTAGPIVTMATGFFGLEFMEIAGATGGALEDDTGGNGVVCPIDANGAVRIIDSVIRDNAATGVRLRKCTATSILSRFTGNGASGLAATDSGVTLDRCTVSDNGNGLNLDGGNFSVTNTFVTRNQNDAIELFLFTGQLGTFAFNTIVDNGGIGFECNAPAGASMPNNIVARNATQTTGSCAFPSSVLADSAISPLMFVSPEVAPFDYHIKPGSIAIGAATVTTIDHDFDGQVRPSSGADVGADEL